MSVCNTFEYLVPLFQLHISSIVRFENQETKKKEWNQLVSEIAAIKVSENVKWQKERIAKYQQQLLQQQQQQQLQLQKKKYKKRP